MITEIEQETSDFDWYFTNGISIGYVASAGGRLPPFISISLENIEILAEYFWSLPPCSDFIINPELKLIMGSRKITDMYLSSFIYLAERGIFAYDKTILNNFDDTSYHLVAEPIHALNFSGLPDNLSNLILKKPDFDFRGVNFSVNQFD